MDLDEAISHALDGNAVLFTGAGFSYGATNIHGARLPAGKALSERLLTEIGYKHTEGSLDKASAAYLRRKSKKDLASLLLEVFSVKDVSISHERISALPWRRTYTTNYDLVFEEARRRIGMPCNSVDGIDSPRDHLAKGDLIVHLNGAINRLTEERLGGSFKLVSQSYATDSFEESEWAFHFRNDLRTASAIIFVGYSMYDLDLRRAVYHEDISHKCVFITAPPTPENELDAEDLSDQGVVAPIGIDAFSDVIERIRKDYLPKETEVLLDVWEEILPIQGATAKPSDAEVIDFFMLGDVSGSLLLEASGPHSREYVIPRDSHLQIVESLRNTNKTVILIGELGVGKTFTSRSIAQVFGTELGAVFVLDRASQDEILEAELISDLDGHKLLIIENYHRHMDLIRWVADQGFDNLSLVLTARTSAHELFAKDIFEIFRNNVLVHDLTKLRDSEQLASVELFDRYGFWGDRISWGRERKASFVLNDCKARLPFLLLDVLKSKHLTERYRKLLVDAPNSGDVEKALICTFSLEVMGFATKTFQIQELLGNKVNWGLLRAKSDLSEFLDFDAHVIRIKSSVLAAHLLHSVFTSKAIVATLIGMANEAEARRSDNEFFQILNSLMRYRSLAAIFPEEDSLSATINFYEGVKNLPAARRNPLFWMQYGIACLAFNKLDRAETYFADAYSFAKHIDGYNTFQIDNHFARLQLEKAMGKPTMDEVIVLVDEARKIVLQQMHTDFRYYPYRVALGFFRCYHRFGAAWSKNHQAYFRRIFEEILRRSEGVGVDLRENRYVKECLLQAKSTLANMPAV